MIDPAKITTHFVARTKAGKSDLMQLLDGVMIGGCVVMGGSPKACDIATSILTKKLGRLGRIQSLATLEDLDPNVTYSFDLAAVAQLIMTTANRAYHMDMQASIEVLTKMNEDGRDLSFAIAVLTDMANKVTKL